MVADLYTLLSGLYASRLAIVYPFCASPAATTRAVHPEKPADSPSLSVSKARKPRHRQRGVDQGRARSNINPSIYASGPSSPQISTDLHRSPQISTCWRCPWGGEGGGGIDRGGVCWQGERGYRQSGPHAGDAELSGVIIAQLSQVEALGSAVVR